MPMDNNIKSLSKLMLQPDSHKLGQPATNPIIVTISSLIDPFVFTVMTLVIPFLLQGSVTPSYLLCALAVFLLTFPGKARLESSFWGVMFGVAKTWLLVCAVLLVVSYLVHASYLFNEHMLSLWLWSPPLIALSGHAIFRLIAPRFLLKQKKAVCVGMTSHGLIMARRVRHAHLSDIKILGFFDDRVGERVSNEEFTLLGKVDALADYIKLHKIDVIYVTLAMTSQPRILQMLDELRDTTVSIYFVPDVFVTDLIQGRVDSLCNMPVIAVCDSPFSGSHSFIKRGSDIVLSIIILLLISPLMLLVALGVKLSSPGPVIFVQRRYGLNGEEIYIYKFRSMTVCEDGNVINQAKKYDSRITKFGAFIRKSSLDELPQFINVLQGRMSIVGPRPHAVAHNEQYRKLIKGYMVRHKVKPGITGLAQVSGCRGETDTLEKMRQRIEYDIEYLRRWSLGLDLQIIFRTVTTLVKGDKQAY
ncbi:undecaprenyl-phosphate glucose phosphotransferase [Aquitalea sp. S1-19]|nr:undecaprenyl-phosphate glucose phosphotransferase [Aquitalea sp. S1-19]